MSLARNIGDLPNGDDAPVFACRAWVNFNGTGTVAIRDSGNVTSITDLGTGFYKANFTTNMPDTNYVVVGSSRPDNSSVAFGGVFLLGRNSNDVTALEADGATFTTCRGDQNTFTDSTLTCVAIFR
jgi:hypothetical protein